MIDESTLQSYLCRHMFCFPDEYEIFGMVKKDDPDESGHSQNWGANFWPGNDWL